MGHHDAEFGRTHGAGEGNQPAKKPQTQKQVRIFGLNCDALRGQKDPDPDYVAQDEEHSRADADALF